MSVASSVRYLKIRIKGQRFNARGVDVAKMWGFKLGSLWDEARCLVGSKRSDADSTSRKSEREHRNDF